MKCPKCYGKGYYRNDEGEKEPCHYCDFTGHVASSNDDPDRYQGNSGRH